MASEVYVTQRIPFKQKKSLLFFLKTCAELGTSIKVKITKTTYTLNEFQPNVIHKYIPHDKPDFERANWIFIPGYQKQKGITWLNVKQWNEPAEIGIPDTGDDGEDGGWGENGGEFFNCSKLKGHQVLSIANTIDGTSIHNTSHWYRSAKLAKKLTKHHYKGFLY